MKEKIKRRIEKRLQRGGDVTSPFVDRDIFKAFSLYLITGQTKDWQVLVCCCFLFPPL